MIIKTIQINEKNTREVQTKDGAKLVSTVFLYPFGYIGNNWCPSIVTWGDYVTIVIDQIKKEERDGKTYYNAEYSKVIPEFDLNKANQGQGAQSSAQVYDDPFGGQAPMDISDSDLPF